MSIYKGESMPTKLEIETYKRVQNPVGLKFRRVTVIKELKPEGAKDGLYDLKIRRVLLRCECGNTFERKYSDVYRGLVKECASCAAKHKRKINPKELIGRTFGWLTVKEARQLASGENKYLYICECACGNTIATTEISTIVNGLKVSCGCKSSGARDTLIKANRRSTNLAKARWNKIGRECIGQEFNKFKIIGIKSIKTDGKPYDVRVICVCKDCGYQKEFSYKRLSNGVTGHTCEGCRRLKKDGDIENKKCG